MNSAAEDDSDHQQEAPPHEEDKNKAKLAQQAKLQETRRKSHALEKDLRKRESELNELKAQLLKERRQEVRPKEVAGSASDEAVEEFMRDEMKHMMQHRIPMLAPIDERSAKPGDAPDTGAMPEQDESGPSFKRDTVAVSYRHPSQEPHEDDYKVSFRVDHETTLANLHKDACAYWGCSPYEHCFMYSYGPSKMPMVMWSTDPELLGEKHDIKADDKILKRLNEDEHAHLHLVLTQDLREYLAEKQAKEDVGERRDETAKKDRDKEDALKSLKFAQGGALTVEEQRHEEHFVAALWPWFPGIHSLLKYRRRDGQPWRRERMSAFACHSLLIILTILIMVLGRIQLVFLLRQGVVLTLVEGLDGEATELPPQHPIWGESCSAGEVCVANFRTIRTQEDVWAWLGGSLHYQVFNSNSSLRQGYKPVGFLRVRQQRARRLPCARNEDLFPAYLHPVECLSVEVSPASGDLQEKATISIPNGTDWLVEGNLTMTGRLSTPDPLVWTQGNIATFEHYGRTTFVIDGSGYMVDYSLSEQDIQTAGETFLQDLPKLREAWIDNKTRVLAVELTLANYGIGAYVAANFIVEITPSGAVTTTPHLVPFMLGKGAEQSAVIGLDVLRWIIIIPFFTFRRDRTTSQSPSGKGFRLNSVLATHSAKFVSLSGLVDALIMGLFFAGQYVRHKSTPPVPSEESRFYSYTYYAVQQQQLGSLEGFFLLVLMCRLGIMLQMDPAVYRFVQVVRRSLWSWLIFSLIAGPVIWSTIFLGHAIWGPYLAGYNSLSASATSILVAVRHTLDTEELKMYAHPWDIIFTVWFFALIFIFFMNMFLAITVHSFFEVEFLDGFDPKTEKWGLYQWLDWALWPDVYRFLTGEEPGKSQRDIDDDEEEGSDIDDDEDEAEGAEEAAARP